MSELTNKNIENRLKKNFIREMREIKFKEDQSHYEMITYQQTQFEKKHTIAHNMQIKYKIHKSMHKVHKEEIPPSSPPLYTLRSDSQTNNKLLKIENRNKIMLINNSAKKKKEDDELTHSYILKRVKGLFKSISRRRSIQEICKDIELEDYSPEKASCSPKAFRHKASCPDISYSENKCSIALPDIKMGRIKYVIKQETK